MKIYYILLLVFVCFFSSCTKDERGQYAIDKVPPGEVKSPGVQNIAGGAIISYVIPGDEDLLYVKAMYKLSNGKAMEQKSSGYTNSLKIEGIGKSAEVIVTLVAVDRSNNESKPVVVITHPLDAPIYSVLAAINTNNDFGGIRLDWTNPTEADLVISVMTNDAGGKFVVTKNFYTNAKNGTGNVRGFPSADRIFGIYIRDRWGNVTDTVKANYLPLFEEEIKAPFARWNPTGIPYTSYQPPTYDIEKMWDGNIATFYLQVTTAYPWSFTFDLGKLVKLSRLHQWQRQGSTLIFTSQNVMQFELWGSATSNVNSSFAGWTKIGDFTGQKPSGLPQGQNSAEDTDLAVSGEDYNIDPTAPPVRYIRYVIKSTWSGDANAAIAETKFFGSVK